MMPDASIAEINFAAELITVQQYVRYYCQERAPATTRKKVTNMK